MGGCAALGGTRPSEAARPVRVGSPGMSDDAELIAYVRSRVGDEYGLTEAQARRLRGATVREFRADAKAMRDELDLEPRPRGPQAARGRRARRRGAWAARPASLG